MQVIRSILSILIGFVATMVGILVVQSISMSMHPMPEGLKMDDEPAMKAWIATLPTSAFVLVLASYVVGSYVGGGVAALIASWGRMGHAGVIGLLVLAATIVNFRSFGEVHPDWVVVASYALPVPVSLFAGWLVTRMIAKRAN